MTNNLLNFLAPIIDFIVSVFDFLVEKTGSEIMAYVSMILVELLAVALLVFIIIAIIKGCRRKKTKKSTPETSTVSNSTESTPSDENVSDLKATEDETVETPINESAPTSAPVEDTVENTAEEKIESAPVAPVEASNNTPTEVKPAPKKSQGKIYDDGIPAMPIYRKSKYEKPRTILVKKDKSKLRNGSTENK